MIPEVFCVSNTLATASAMNRSFSIFLMRFLSLFWVNQCDFIHMNFKKNSITGSFLNDHLTVGLG